MNLHSIGPHCCRATILYTESGLSSVAPYSARSTGAPSALIIEARTNLVVDRGLEPAILCVRGRPPDHLEESTINKALNYCKMGIEPIYFSWKENVITIRLFAKEFAVRAFALNLALWRRNTHFHYRLKCRTAGASDGDRTRTTCLEGRDSTIELHPHSCSCSF